MKKHKSQLLLIRQREMSLIKLYHFRLPGVNYYIGRAKRWDEVRVVTESRNTKEEESN